LKFKPIHKNLVWGYELWLLGGNTEVANSNISLNDIMKESPQYLFGKGDVPPKFPLLIKFISTNEWLSIQVHPDNLIAQHLEKELWGKSEMWYFVQTEADSQIIHGFNFLIKSDELEKAIQDKSIQRFLRFDHPNKSDWIYIPAGCIHALGKNLKLLEIQQNSEITYRLYDWDRHEKDGNPRELHLSKALQSIHFEDEKTHLRSDPLNQSLENYQVKTIQLNGKKQLDTCGLSFHILIAIEKAVLIDHNFKLNPFECCLIPGSVGSYDIEGENQQVFLIKKKGDLKCRV